MSPAGHGGGIKKFASSAHRLVRLAEFFLPVIIASLEVGELIREGGVRQLPLELGKVVTNADFATVLWRASLVLYFLSWVLGAESDIDAQEEVYLVAPREGTLSTQDIGVGLGIAVVFGVLCWVSNNYRAFAVALTGFWIVNVITWRYLVRLLATPIHESRALYERDARYIELERLRIAENYIAGNWQQWRFAIGALLAIVMNGLAWFDLSRGYAAASIFVFVLSVEAWMWLMRLRRKLALKALEEFGERYGEKLKIRSTAGEQRTPVSRGRARRR